MLAALESTAAGRWTPTVATLERLAGEYGDTLVVLLLSDGTTAGTTAAGTTAVRSDAVLRATLGLRDQALLCHKLFSVR